MYEDRIVIMKMFAGFMPVMSNRFYPIDPP